MTGIAEPDAGPTAATPSSYVGFATIPKQVERRLARRPFDLNIMVVGMGGCMGFRNSASRASIPRLIIAHIPPLLHDVRAYHAALSPSSPPLPGTLSPATGQGGTGKRTFVNTLFATNLSSSGDSEHAPGTAAASPSTVDTLPGGLRARTFALAEGGVTLHLTLIDAEGFGDQVNNDGCWEPLTAYVRQRYTNHLRRELAADRPRHSPDERVHCIFYFIAPSGHSLKPLDIVTMKALGDVANVVPIIGRSDILTVDERVAFKQRIKRELEYHSIRTFPALPHGSGDGIELTSEERALDDSMRQMMPFAVVGSDVTADVGGGKHVRVRRNKWGVVNVEDPLHCDFVHVRNFLMRTHTQALVEATVDSYEAFRRQQMASSQAQKR